MIRFLNRPLAPSAKPEERVSARVLQVEPKLFQEGNGRDTLTHSLLEQDQRRGGLGVEVGGTEEAFESRISEAEIIRHALTRHFRQRRPRPEPEAID